MSEKSIWYDPDKAKKPTGEFYQVYDAVWEDPIRIVMIPEERSCRTELRDAIERILREHGVAQATVTIEVRG